MSNTTTRLIDIPSTILAILVIIGGVVLFYVGKIAWIEFSFCLGVAAALIGRPVLLKDPSPAQSQQLSTLAETAQTHTDQITAQQQQLGQVQDLAVRAANSVSYLQQQVQAPAPVQQVPLQTLNLTPAAASPNLQFMQPIPQPIPQYVDYGRHFGDSQVMPIAAQSTQKIPAP